MEDVSDTPGTVAQQLEEGQDEPSRSKGKGKAVVGTMDSNFLANGLPNTEVTVDWTQYEPPDGLNDIEDFTSDIIAQIIQQSIDRVKGRIVEEAERRKAEEELKILRQEEKPTQGNDKDKSIGISIPLNGESDEKSVLLETPSPTSLGLEGRGSLAPERPTKSKKRRLMNLLRRLNNIGEKGESSAAGAARHRRDVSWGSFEMSNQVTKNQFVSKVLKRTTTNSNSSLTSSIHGTEVECVSCLDDFSPKEMVKAPCHSYCKPCFLRLIHTTCENEQQWPPKCCLNPIPTNIIILNIDDDLKKTYHDRAAEWNLPVSDRVYCSQSNCSVWIRPYEINRSRNIARCSAGHWTCTTCRGQQHEGDECPQDRDMMRTDELAEEEGWKRCYGCHAYVEHGEACQHMTCRCGAEFCYVCGARWRTCSCSMEQLVAIKQAAETRRQARQNREAEEEAEIREALRLVEEFEREEARKAELLRQEQERLAEERREKLLDERIRREGERRREVGVRFQELRDTFVNIHKLQRAAVLRKHNEEEADITSQGNTALAQFKQKREKDYEKLTATAKVKLSKKENAFKREHSARVAEERRIEEKYQIELKAYWSRRLNSEDKAEAAMRELKRKMDNSFKSWEKWKDNELDNYRWVVREEVGIQEELMDDTETKLIVSTQEKLTAFSLRKAAEARWVSIVIEERERMLTDMEVDEIENGENVEAWFEDDGLDDCSMEDLGIPNELRVPGAWK
ncbi:hypothetical protein F4804DRAFT_304111 [Jackrogersella minutella]|nr:hypothetical protein F4804DRAFT_304111 [Jackrogersella minutella]